MSGLDGIRGYLLQTLVSLLESFQDQEWDEVHLEPNTKKDKIDVIWYQNGKAIIGTQIKSSINSFSKRDISDWLRNLIGDFSCEKYSLILLGGFEDGTLKFIRKINENGEFSKQEMELVNGIDQLIQERSLEIKRINFDGDISEYSDVYIKVQHNVIKYLTPDFEVSHRIVKSLTKELIAEFTLLSAQSRKILTRKHEKNA